MVVMDNLSLHKVVGVKQAIEGAGAEPRYLPPYSPDYHPIEQSFAKLKARCCERPGPEPLMHSGAPLANC